MKLQASERALIGNWIATESGVVADEVAKRVKELTESYLVHLAADPTGWDHLYRDPADGRLWELTYPSSDWHGGGPPHLKVVSTSYAAQKYSWPRAEID